MRAYTSLPTIAENGNIVTVMAIYHFSAKVISRANGSSAVASAAYRAAERLHDDRLGRYHDFSNKAGVVHSEAFEGGRHQSLLSDRPPARHVGLRKPTGGAANVPETLSGSATSTESIL